MGGVGIKKTQRSAPGLSGVESVVNGEKKVTLHKRNGLVVEINNMYPSTNGAAFSGYRLCSAQWTGVHLDMCGSIPKCHQPFQGTPFPRRKEQHSMVIKYNVHVAKIKRRFPFLSWSSSISINKQK